MSAPLNTISTDNATPNFWRTFACKELLLCSLHVIDTIKHEGKLLRFVLGIRNADDIHMTVLLAALGTHNNIFVEFLA